MRRPGGLRFPSPASVFLVLGGLLGTALFFASPPMRWGDENTHFQQAVRLAEGELRPACATDGASSLPQAIVRFIYFVSLLPERDVISRRAVRDLGVLTVEPGNRVPVQIERAPYSPLPYVGQAAAVTVARPVTGSALGWFYAARIGNFVAWLALTWLAIRLAPGFGWSMACIALCPMALFLATTCSVDAAVNAVGFLWAAVVLHVAAGPGEKLERSGVLGLCALAVALGLTKVVYVVLVPLALVIPARRVGGRRALLALVALLLALSAGAACAWMALAGPECLSGIGGTGAESVAAQWRSLIDDPSYFLRLLGDQATRVRLNLAAELADTKWLLPRVPTVLSRLLVGAVVLGLLCDERFPGSLSLVHRTLALAVAAGAFVAIVLVAFVYWTPAGGPAVRGVQMRYLLPLLPLLLIALKPPPLPVPARARRLGGCAATLAVVPVVVHTIQRGLALFAP